MNKKLQKISKGMEGDRCKEIRQWGSGGFLVAFVLSSVWKIKVKTLNLKDLALPQGEIPEPDG